MINQSIIRRFATKMSATNYLNETIYPISFPHQSNQDLNYCVLPTLHSHTFEIIFHEDEIRLLNNNGDQNDDMDQKSSSNRNHLTKGQLLDPYIDAVHVKNRVNNKRGARVRAATINQHTNNIKSTSTSASKRQPSKTPTSDHEPNPSYYSKTVHVEEHKEAHDKWDYSSADSSDDEDDDLHHHKKKKKGKHYHKKPHHHGKKKYGYKPKSKKKVYAKVYKKRPKAKVVYVKHVGHHPKKKKGYEKHHGKHDYDYRHHYKDDHHLDDHHKHYDHHYHHDKPNKYHDYDEKKKIYVKSYGHDEHDNLNHHHHHHGKSKGKLIHLDLMGKGKMSLAGVLGYTLLCVNYLLVLKQPTYDKYSGHYYTKYQPHGGHGDTVELKSGGPVILAHCGELPDQRGLVHVASSQVNASAPATINPTGDVTSVINMTKSLQAAEQQEVVYLRDRTHTLANYQAGQPMTNPGLLDSNNHRGLLGPIQSALNRLFLLPGSTNNNNLDQFSDDHGVVSRQPMQQQQLINEANGRQRLLTGNAVVLNNRDNNAPGSAALINANGRRVILVNGQPQVIQTRDNLAEMRTRQIEIGLRIAEGRRFGLPQRQLSLLNNPTTNGNFNVNRPLGVAVRPPEFNNFDDQPQNDQPDNSNNNQVNANQVQLDLPEYALAGDSIELTCNHRMAMNRLLSVRWFKDAIEFYRFVPADMRPKTGFFLPDVLLDLARSTAQSILLRNVTHRTSGFYRCEVISEAPTFEVMSGERQMRIYALPDTGPQLTLLDRPITDRPLLLVNGRQIGLADREVEEDDFSPPISLDGRRAQIQMALNGQQQNNQPGPGPIIRCSSDRSNPVAQLRFFINNQPIGLTRTIENSTLSYSDGLESNVVSFRLQLSDFIFDNSNGLERAASLDNEKSKNRTESNKNATKTATTTSTTTTTTTTTPKPNATKLKVDRKNVGNDNRKQNDKMGPNANAGVQFDDENSPNSKLDKRKLSKLDDKSTTNNQQQRKRNKKKKSKGEKKSGNGSSADFNEGNFVSSDDTAKFVDPNSLEDGDVGGFIDETVQSVQKAPDSLPSGGIGHDISTREKQDNVPIGDEINAEKKTTPVTQYSEIKSIRTRSMASFIAKANELEGDINRLDVAEQRHTTATNNNNLISQEQNGNPRTITSRINALRSPNNQQQQQAQVFANFIRIKCASLVPNLGYEMTSELTVPLTLLVPASQLSDTLRQTALISNNNADSRRDQTGGTGEASRRSDNDGPSNQSGNSNRLIRNGGSLQAPRTVSVDRVAQASGAPKLFYNPLNSLKQQQPPTNAIASNTINIHRDPLILTICSIFVNFSIGHIIRVSNSYVS